MKKMTRWILAVLLLALVAGIYFYPRLIATRQADAATPGPSSAASGTPSAATPRPTGPVITVQTAIATRQDVPIMKQAVGWVEPIATVAVRTRIDGIVVAQAVTDGQIVKAGDLLFRLDDAALQATVAKDQASIAKDQANLDQGNADLKRDQSLIGRNDVVTQQQLEQQQALVKTLQATVAIDKAQLQADEVQLGYTTIKAPIAGRVGVVNVTPGNLVRATDQTAMLTITQMAPVRVTFPVPEQDLSAYRAALAAATPATTDALDAASGATLASGKLDFIDSIVDTTSGTVTVKAAFDNANLSLWPGQYVRVSTQVSLLKDATVVPLAAVQINDTGSFVYVAKPDGKVARQPVKVASSLGQSAVIGSGLQPGDHVVIEGQLRLNDGSAVKETVASAAPVAPPATANP